MTKISIAAIFATVVLVAGNCSGYAATVVYIGQPRSTQQSMNEADHDPWDELLEKYVDSDGRVDYASWKASPGDLEKLSRYLDHLSSASQGVAATRGARLAFWINAYNAVTIHGILREYPTTSIRNHTARLFGYNIWKHLQLYVGGEPVSLEHIEHQVLRKMDEPRIHFAIVCASNGCPRLLNQAYRAERIDDQLENNAKDFFSRTENFRYDGASMRFDLSAILKWFAEDFGADQASQLRTISRWLPSKAAREAALSNSVTVSYLDYD